MIAIKSIAKCDGLPRRGGGAKPCKHNSECEILLRRNIEFNYLYTSPTDWMIRESGDVMCPLCIKEMMNDGL